MQQHIGIRLIFVRIECHLLGEPFTAGSWVEFFVVRHIVVAYLSAMKNINFYDIATGENFLLKGTVQFSKSM